MAKKPDTPFPHAKMRALLTKAAAASPHGTLSNLSMAALGSPTALYTMTDPAHRKTVPRLQSLIHIAEALGCKASDLVRAIGF